jgi:hypothetical protein
VGGAGGGGVATMGNSPMSGLAQSHLITGVPSLVSQTGIPV